MIEHSIVVVFDIRARSRQDAAQALGHAIGRDGLLGELRYRAQDHDADANLESWWFPEADLKDVDRNDNACMHLVHDDDGTGAPTWPEHDVNGGGWCRWSGVRHDGRRQTCPAECESSRFTRQPAPAVAP